MNNQLKIALVAGIGTIGLVGIVHNSFAQASVNSPVAILQSHKVANSDGGIKDDAKGQQESAKLQQLAKITPQQARVVAEAKQGETASSVKLENEHGSVVYAVIIGQAEVTVDAGNGRILYTENNQKNGNEGAEHTHIKSSIQASVNAGDDDAQTNDDG